MKPLRIDPLGPEVAFALLQDYVWGGTEWATTAWQVGPTDRRLTRSRLVPLSAGGFRRELRSWEWRPEGLRALDLTVFHLDDTTFAEVEQRRTLGGPNLRATAIRLPARLPLGVPVEGPGGATVALTWVGPARISGGLVPEGAALDCICLEAAQDGRHHRQWLARGVGELALGAPGAGFERWVIGFEAPDGTGRLRGLPDGTPRGPWPDLAGAPAGDAGPAPRRGIW